MTPIKLMFITLTASLLCCCSETKTKKVEKPQNVPSTEKTTTPPINKVDSAKITNEIPEKKTRIIKPRVKPEIKNDTLTHEKIIHDNKIPAIWEQTFSSNKKWMELYALSKSSFIKGWKNEFDAKPTTRINEYELVFAYRRRMESAFNKSPEFIEFSVQRFSKDPDFLSFIKAFPIQVKPD
jgi:hypothetical protein